MCVGLKGPGLFDISDSSSQVSVTNLRFGPSAAFAAEPNSVICIVASDDASSYQVDGRFDVDKDANAADLSGLGNLTLVCGFAEEGYDPNVVISLEAAGGDPPRWA